MSVIDTLLSKYARLIRIPWPKAASGAERVLMLVYPPRDERTLRARIDEFEIETKAAGHQWLLLDITDEFARWMSNLDYRDSYFEHPEDMRMMLENFGDYLDETTTGRLENADDNTVVGLMGLGCLFGLYSVSALLDRLSEGVDGRLLAFFPGVRENNNYRLLDAKDGWSYLAIPIDTTEDES